MSQKPGTTTGQALKMALKDVGGGMMHGLLFVAFICLTLGVLWAGKALLEAYYPVYTQVMSILACMMVPGLIVTGEVLIRARNILGDLPRRKRRKINAAILAIQVVQIATIFALAWMIYHSAWLSPGFMLPVMVVCCIVQAVASFGRIAANRTDG